MGLGASWVCDAQARAHSARAREHVLSACGACADEHVHRACACEHDKRAANRARHEDDILRRPTLAEIGRGEWRRRWRRRWRRPRRRQGLGRRRVRGRDRERLGERARAARAQADAEARCGEGDQRDSVEQKPRRATPACRLEYKRPWPLIPPSGRIPPCPGPTGRWRQAGRWRQGGAYQFTRGHGHRVLTRRRGRRGPSGGGPTLSRPGIPRCSHCRPELSSPAVASELPSALQRGVNSDIFSRLKQLPRFETANLKKLGTVRAWISRVWVPTMWVRPVFHATAAAALALARSSCACSS